MSAIRSVARRGAEGLGRHPRAALATAAALSIALVVAGTVGLVVLNLHALLAAWGDRVHLIGFLEHDVTEQERAALSAALGRMQEVAAIRLVTSAEAREALAREMGEERDLLGTLEENPLPAAVEVTLKMAYVDRDHVAGVQAKLLGLAPFGEVIISEAWVQHYAAFRTLLGVVTWAVGGLVAVSALLISVAALSLSLAARREEVAVLRLVGATGAYVRGSFAVEGMLLGGLGSLVSLGVVGILFTVVAARIDPALLGTLGGMRLLFFTPGQVATLAGVGVVLGAVGSLVGGGRVWRRGLA